MELQEKNIDLHVDLALCVRAKQPEQVSVGMLQKNTRLFFGSVFIEPTHQKRSPQELHRLIRQGLDWYRMISDHGFHSMLTGKDFAAVRENATAGVLIHLEGADALTPETEEILDEWYRSGLRSMGLVWNTDNLLGVSAATGHPTKGLTVFGKRIIKKLNDRGILIDCSHLNQKGFYDVLRLSRTPPFVSHGNADALCPHPRNFTDQQIRDLKNAGGVIGVFFSGKYVKRKGIPTLQDVVEHIRHMVDVAGIEAVAVGSDFGGITSGFVEGLSRMNDMPNLVDALSRNGFSKKDIEKIMYGNAGRYLSFFFKL